MHEYSIIMSMISLCEKHSNGQPISKIVMNIGKMSGVDPHFLKESFSVFSEETLCSEAEVEMNIIDITIECQDCRKTSVVENHNFFCPHCKGSDTKVLTGKEMHIDYIETKDSE